MLNLKNIRKKLSLTVEIVSRHVFIPATAIVNKEIFYLPTSREEFMRLYDVLQKSKTSTHFRQEL